MVATPALDAPSMHEISFSKRRLHRSGGQEWWLCSFMSTAAKSIQGMSLLKRLAEEPFVSKVDGVGPRRRSRTPGPRAKSGWQRGSPPVIDTL